MINLTITGTPNISLAVGDTLYYTFIQSGPDDAFESSDNNEGQAKIVELGTVSGIAPQGSTFVLLINEVPNIDLSQLVGAFLLFSKDNQFELSSIVGYYNSIRLKNNSKEKAELFAVSVDVTESSK